MRKISSAFPTNSASGEIVVFADGSDSIPTKKLMFNLSPHQSGSGDPSPDNVRSISGYTAVKVTRTGKNLLNYDAWIDTRVINGTGVYEQNGVTLTATASDCYTAYNSPYYHEAAKIPVKEGATYTLTWDTDSTETSSRVLVFFNGNSSQAVRAAATAKKLTFTVGSGVSYVTFRVGIGESGKTYYFRNLQLEVGNTATDFAPYQGETYTITIPTAAGTVYGGSLTVNDDGSGTLTVDRAMWTDDGTANWSRSADGSFYVWKREAANAAFEDNGACNYAQYKVQYSGLTAYARPTNSTFALGTGWGTYYADAESLKAAFAATPLQIVYPLAEPQTYTLTADQVTTLLGDNSIWMDADGSIDLVYRADTTKYIDDRIALLNSNLAYIEDGTTASRAYSVGQYVTIDGKLYKVASAIAKDAAFTIGTNVVATTVGTELTALN